MSQEKADRYMSDRVDDQISWYDRKAKSNKRAYHISKIVSLTSSAFIPFFAGQVANDSRWLLAISLCGISTTLSEGLSSLFKSHENWLHYRATSEHLKHEKYMYLSLAGPYDAENIDAEKTLVQRVEELTSSENVNWANMNTNEKGDHDGRP